MIAVGDERSSTIPIVTNRLGGTIRLALRPRGNQTGLLQPRLLRGGRTALKKSGRMAGDYGQIWPEDGRGAEGVD